MEKATKILRICTFYLKIKHTLDIWTNLKIASIILHLMLEKSWDKEPAAVLE